MRIDCKTLPVEKAIRILRRRLDRDGRKERQVELEFYEKPTAKKKRMKAAAVKRQEKITNEYRKYTRKRLRHERT
jgi:ribosomal protein S21